MEEEKDEPGGEEQGEEVRRKIERQKDEEGEYKRGG